MNIRDSYKSNLVGFMKILHNWNITRLRFSKHKKNVLPSRSLNIAPENRPSQKDGLVFQPSTFRGYNCFREANPQPPWALEISPQRWSPCRAHGLVDQWDCPSDMARGKSKLHAEGAFVEVGTPFWYLYGAFMYLLDKLIYQKQFEPVPNQWWAEFPLSKTTIFRFAKASYGPKKSFVSFPAKNLLVPMPSNPEAALISSNYPGSFLSHPICVTWATCSTAVGVKTSCTIPSGKLCKTMKNLQPFNWQILEIEIGKYRKHSTFQGACSTCYIIGLLAYYDSLCFDML